MDDLYLTATHFFDFQDQYEPIGKKTYIWVKCQQCNADIERSKGLGNRKFTCYDCKRKNQAIYDKQKNQK